MQQLTDSKLAAAFASAGVSLAVLFGSAARGRLRTDSDIDIGVLIDQDMTLDEEARLATELERLLAREVDLVRLDRASTLLRFQASRGRRLYERRPGAFADFVSRALLEHDDLSPVLRRCGEGMFRAIARSA